MHGCTAVCNDICRYLGLHPIEGGAGAIGTGAAGSGGGGAGWKKSVLEYATFIGTYLSLTMHD